MKTLSQKVQSERRASIVWGILTPVFLLLMVLPFVAEGLIEFDGGMALAFFSMVMAIVSFVTFGIYARRKKLLLTLCDPSELLAEWNSPDSFQENGGKPIPALFGRKGVFYAGRPYCMRSYDCIIKGAQIIFDEEVPSLSIRYTVPGSRSGIRHKSVVNIPIPEGKFSEAERLCGYYSSAAQSAAQ